ncbi:MAG: YtxH domain-containing protein [Desulfitobacteriaceae bacterium]
MANEVSKESSLSTVVIAALVGGIAGAAVGLMLSPKSGQELRQDIGSKARQTFQELQEVTEAKVGTLEDVREDMLREGKRLVDDLKTLFGEYRRVRTKAETEIAAETEGQP